VLTGVKGHSIPEGFQSDSNVASGKKGRKCDSGIFPPIFRPGCQFSSVSQKLAQTGNGRALEKPQSASK